MYHLYQCCDCVFVGHYQSTCSMSVCSQAGLPDRTEHPQASSWRPRWQALLLVNTLIKSFVSTDLPVINPQSECLLRQFTSCTNIIRILHKLYKSILLIHNLLSSITSAGWAWYKSGFSVVWDQFNSNMMLTGALKDISSVHQHFKFLISL